MSKPLLSLKGVAHILRSYCYAEARQMNQFDRALTKAVEETVPQLHVVPAPYGAPKKEVPSAPLRILVHVKARKLRPELSVLDWSHREQRLTAKK